MTVDTKENKEEGPREQWGNKAEFLLSCIGLSVGLGNVWRFPNLAYENGGGAFLIPYLIILFLVGKPMYYMELALGQFTQAGAVKSFKNMVPASKGIGIAMSIVCLITTIYYNVLMAYCVHYIGATFSSTLPWTHCDWEGADSTICVARCNKAESGNQTCNGTLAEGQQSSAEHYYERNVLNSIPLESFGSVGALKWDLSLCLLLSWLIVFICLFKGIKSSGKVVYVTATLPFLILFILLIRGVTLEGAGAGIEAFFVPDFNQLLKFEVWRRAAEQVFFSLAVAWGSLIMFGSYNKFSNNVTRDAMIVSVCDTVTSLIAGMAIFSVLGNLSLTLGVEIEKVSAGGPGLAFQVYAEALSLLPVPQLWSFIFFVMLFTLGLDSEFALLETVLTSVYDGYPQLKSKRLLCTAVICIFGFFTGLPCVTQAGTHIFSLMDDYAGFGITIIAILEMVTIMWIYGVNNFCRDLEFMLKKKVSIVWKILWAGVTPPLLIVILGGSLNNIQPSAIPVWAKSIGWFLAMISIIQIPIWAGFAIFKYYKREQNIIAALKATFQPTPEWGPGEVTEKLNYKNLLQDYAGDYHHAAYDNPIHLTNIKTEIARF